MIEHSFHKRILSEDEIETLFQFAEKKRVRWYDLQIEIVDHLASAIEAEMETNTALTFEQALERVYARFGIFGFARIVQERENNIKLLARKKWRREFLKLFKWPEIFFVFFLVTVLWWFSLLCSGEVRSYIFFGVYFICCFFQGRKVARDRRIFKKKLMLIDSTSGGLPFLFLWVPIFFAPPGNMSAHSFILFTGLTVLAIMAWNKVYENVKNEAQRLYPAVFAD